MDNTKTLTDEDRLHTHISEGEQQTLEAVQITLDHAIDRFLEIRRLKGVSQHTLDLYTGQFRRWVGWRVARDLSPRLCDVTIEELRDFFEYLRNEHVPYSDNPYRRPIERLGLSPETRLGIWKLLSAAWRFWIDEELLSDRQMVFFARGRIPAPRVPERIRPIYESTLVEILLAADGPKPRPESTARDRAIILLLYDTGMRVSELCRLHDEDMRLDARQAVVVGKGDKQRFVFWTERTASAITAYRAIRRGMEGGSFVRGVGTGGRATKSNGKALGPGAIRDILERRAAIVEKNLPAAAVHAFRHTFAHRFLDNGGDGLHLQQLLGHGSIVTTMRYVRENPTGLRRTYRRIMED